jgi:hypothetical protein
MSMLFIETTAVTKWVNAHLSDDDYADFQRSLADNPGTGKVIPKCGGLRKVRIADPSRQQGKRGGARVIYLHIPEADRIYFVAAYDKDQKEDLSPDEQKILRTLVQTLRNEVAQDKPKKGKKGSK